MGANYKQLTEFTKQIERLNKDQKEQFLESCCKELAARLLAKVVDNTPVRTGTLRRGWTGGVNANKSQAANYAQSLQVKKNGDKYIIDIINPVEYASYVEYGHRKNKEGGWTPGQFILTIAETELNNMSDAILQKKLRKFIEKTFNE